MSEYQMHHANWTRRSWTNAHDKSLRAMRKHSGLIVPVFEANHRLLHAELEPTPMPVRPVALDLLEEIGEFRFGADRVEIFKQATRFLMAEAMRNPKPYYAESCRKLGGHYLQQLGFIALEEEVAEAALLERYPRAA